MRPREPMTVTVILGTQWGDEGKGKITDYLAQPVEIIARFQGGNNAGHTIVVGDEVFKLHHLPSGIIRSDKRVMIGNGVVLDPEIFVKELEGLEERGYTTTNLRISPRSNVIMPYHKIQEGLEEAAKGKNKIGTTGRGIGPCYSDKIARNGVRFFELIDADRLRERLKMVVPLKKRYLHALDPAVDGDLDVESILARYEPVGSRLRPYVADVGFELHQTLELGGGILLEGAQGTMLDIDHGTYPFVTSSNTVAGNAATGSGLGPKDIDHIIGVVKAYTTRVGAGPFTTELTDEIGDQLRDNGDEYGTTTGRPRRCGWLDLVVVNYAVKLNSITGLAITKLDVLAGLDELRICTGYEYEGELLASYPTSLEILKQCTPRYTTLPGFESFGADEAAQCEKDGYEALPVNTRSYLEFIYHETGVPIDLISYGPKRRELIDLRGKFAVEE